MGLGFLFVSAYTKGARWQESDFRSEGHREIQDFTHPSINPTVAFKTLSRLRPLCSFDWQNLMLC